MKFIKRSIRLSTFEYNALTRCATIHKKTINKIIGDLAAGSLCLCPHHDLLNLNTQKPSCQYDDSAFQGLQFIYETLLLLREMAKLEHPELVNLANSKRLIYFDSKKSQEEQA